jgi:hypothetical protein
MGRNVALALAILCTLAACRQPQPVPVSEPPPSVATPVPSAALTPVPPPNPTPADPAPVGNGFSLCVSGNAQAAPGCGTPAPSPTPTPVPTTAPTQGPVAACAAPSSPYPAPDTQCANGVILSGYEFALQGAGACAYVTPFQTAWSDFEFATHDYGTLRGCAGSNNFFNNYLSMTQYSGISGASLTYYTQRAFEGAANNEAVFYHYADPAKLSAAPLSASSCLVAFQSDYFDTGGDSYVIYDAANNAPLTTLTSTAANQELTFTDARSGTHYYYVDYVPVNTSISANIASGQQTVTPASASAAGTVWYNMYLLICSGNVGNPAGCGADKEVVKANNVNSVSAPTTFSANFANAHTCPCLVYAEVPYGGLDPMDGVRTNDSGTMPNIPHAGLNAYYPGTRLGSVANANGTTAPSCTTAAPSATPVLSAYYAAPSPNPLPPSWTSNSNPPATGTAVAPKVTVYQTATAQAAPTAYYCYENYCNSWTNLASQAWSSASTGFANTNSWALTAGTIPTALNRYGYAQPMIFEVCAGAAQPPWPTNNCTPPFVGQQSENERVSFTLGQTNGRLKAMCSPAARKATADETDAVYGTGEDSRWATTFGLLQTPARSNKVLTRADDYGTIGSSLAAAIADTTSGDPYLPNNDDDANCQFIISVENFANDEAANGWFSMTHVGIANTPAQMKQIIANSAQLIDIVDGFLYTNNGASNCGATMGKCFYDQIDVPVAEVMNGIGSIVHPRQETTLPGIFTQRYNAFAIYLVIKDDAIEDGHQRMSFRDVYTGYTGTGGGGCNAGCLDPIYYVPIGHALAPQAGAVGPCGDTYSTSCNFGASVGDWNAADGMYERHFTHGDVYFCPPSGGLNQTNCNGKVITLPQAEYLLNASTAVYDNASPGARVYSASPQTTFTAAVNTGYIFMISKS